MLREILHMYISQLHIHTSHVIHLTHIKFLIELKNVFIISHTHTTLHFQHKLSYVQIYSFIILLTMVYYNVHKSIVYDLTTLELNNG